MDRLPTILIVEDYEYHLKLLGDILRRNGYTVKGATNIDDALKQIQEFQDGAASAEEAQEKEEDSLLRLIVTIDVAIPQSSDSLTLKRGGITLLEKLHKDYPEIPAILLTVFGEADDVIEMAKQYNVPIISKPLDSRQLLQVVRNMLPN